MQILFKRELNNIMFMKRSSSLLRGIIKKSGSRFFPVFMALSFGFLLIYLFFVTELFELRFTKELLEVEGAIFSEESIGFGRKLLQSPGDEGEGGGIGTITTCSKEDISIFQGQTAPLPNGTPSYTVQILNSCVSSCTIADIHVKCGWFSSIRLVNPDVFRRVDYDDCLVNDGEPLAPGQVLSFQYANSFYYPLSVSSVAC